MGLDMYLNAKRFIFYGEEELGDKIAEAFPELKNKTVKGVTVEAIYWRKANAIHKWFVDNVQDGKDDCGYYRVSHEKLMELRDLILEVLESKDATKLPPQAGFFFGSVAVDDWYWSDLRGTAERIDECLEQFSESTWEFEYHSSW